MLLQQVVADLGTGHKVKIRINMPDGEVDWSVFLSGLYNDEKSAAYTKFGMKNFRPMVACCADKDVVLAWPEEMKELRDIVLGWCPEDSHGVVRVWDGCEPSTARHRDYPLARTEPTWVVPPLLTSLPASKSLKGGGETTSKVAATLGPNLWLVRKLPAYRLEIVKNGGTDLEKLYHKGESQYDPKQLLVACRNKIRRPPRNLAGPPSTFEFNLSFPDLRPCEDGKKCSAWDSSSLKPQVDDLDQRAFEYERPRASAVPALKLFNERNADHTEVASVFGIIEALVEKTGCKGRLLKGLPIETYDRILATYDKHHSKSEFREPPAELLTDFDDFALSARSEATEAGQVLRRLMGPLTDDAFASPSEDMRQTHAAMLRLHGLQELHAHIFVKDQDTLDAGDFWDGAAFSVDHEAVGSLILKFTHGRPSKRGPALGEVVAVRDQEGALLHHVLLHTGGSMDMQQLEFEEARTLYESTDKDCVDARGSAYKMKQLKEHKKSWVQGAGAQCRTRDKEEVGAADDESEESDAAEDGGDEHDGQTGQGLDEGADEQNVEEDQEQAGAACSSGQAARRFKVPEGPYARKNKAQLTKMCEERGISRAGSGKINKKTSLEQLYYALVHATQAVADDEGLNAGLTDSEARVTERAEWDEGEVWVGVEEERVSEAQAEGSVRGGGRKRRAPAKMNL